MQLGWHPSNDGHECLHQAIRYEQTQLSSIMRKGLWVDSIPFLKEMGRTSSIIGAKGDRGVRLEESHLKNNGKFVDDYTPEEVVEVWIYRYPRHSRRVTNNWDSDLIRWRHNRRRIGLKVQGKLSEADLSYKEIAIKRRKETLARGGT